MNLKIQQNISIWNNLFPENQVERDTIVHWIPCPFHSEKTPSFNVNFEKAVFYCFGCHVGGNFFELVKRIKKFSIEEVGSFFKKFGLSFSKDEKFVPNEQELFDTAKNILDRKLHKQDFTGIDLPQDFSFITNHQYLQKRGLSRQEIVRDKWGVSRSYKNRVILPIYMNEILFSYLARATKDSISPKVKNATNGKSKECVFGLDREYKKEEELYVVEGYFDAVKLKRIGLQAVALNWNKISDAQRKILDGFKKLVFIPDNDSGGKVLLNEASKKFFYEKIYYAELFSKDVDAAKERELKFILKNKKSIIDFLFKK